MVSIDEVARAAGVSTATVSRALSGRGHVSAGAKAKVEAAAKSLGYVVSGPAEWVWRWFTRRPLEEIREPLAQESAQG